MVVHILDAFRDDDTLGRIKLAKLIFNSDFRAMRRLGHPITGATYIKDTFGHNPTQLLTVELDLVARGDAIALRGGEIEPRVIDVTTQRSLALREDRHADLRAFPSNEREILDEVIEEYRDMPGQAMSDESHKTLGWRIAGWKEAIPYQTVYLAEPTTRDLIRAEQVAMRQNLDFAPARD
jgi:hypothetical protein